MNPKRVCIATPRGLRPAHYSGRANGLTDYWIPVPDDAPNARLLEAADDNRPVGVHPAFYYGWPRPADTRDRWTLTTEDGLRVELPAYSFEGACEAAGFRADEVTEVELHERWY